MTKGKKSVPLRGTGPPPLTPEEAVRERAAGLEARRSLWLLLLKLAAIVLAGWSLLTFIFGVSVMYGEEMYPRIRDGDLIVYYRLEREWNIGDIILFTVDGETKYGRIAAKTGDTVDMTDDGLLLINGSAQQEEIFFPTLKEGREQTFPLTLQEGEVFVLQDNRTASVDSRDYGPVPLTRIQGKVISLLRRRGL